MKIEFDVTLSGGDLYRFNMHHAYTKGQGVISLVMAFVSLVAAVKTYGSVELTYTVLYAVFSVLFFIYLPVSLFLRSKRQMLMSEALRRTLHYTVDGDGVHVSQDGDSADLPWDQIYRMVASRRYVWIYSSRVNAYIVPKCQMGDDYERLRQIAGGHLPKHRLKMK